MLDIYKPTAKITGTGCSFKTSARERAIYCSLLKQASWDEKTQRAGFLINKQSPEKSVTIKFNVTEAAAFLEYLDRNRPLQLFHKTSNQSLVITLGPYMSKAEPTKQLGHSFQVHKTVGNTKVSFAIGLNFIEARLLREFLIASIQEIFKYRINERDSYFASQEKNKKPVSESPKKQERPVPETEPEPESFNEPPLETEDETNLDTP